MVGSYMLTDYSHTQYLDLWSYSENYNGYYSFSMVEAIKVCQMLGVKLGSYTGLNLKRNI